MSRGRLWIGGFAALVLVAVGVVVLTGPASSPGDAAVPGPGKRARAARRARPAPSPEPVAAHEAQPAPPTPDLAAAPASQAPAPKPSALGTRDPVAVPRPPDDPTEHPVPPDVRSAAADDGSSIPRGAASLEGRVRQPGGTAVTWLPIRLRPLYRNDVVASTFTDENGFFRFPEVATGRYKLDIGPQRTPIAYAPDRLRLDPGPNRYDFRSPRLGEVRVQVVELGTGKRVAGAHLVLKEEYGHRWKGLTGPDGLADFRNLPVGQYRILLLRDGIPVAEQAHTVIALSDQEVDLELPPPAPPEPRDPRADG